MKLRLSQAAEVRLGRQRAPQHQLGDHVVPYLRSANVVDGSLNLDDVNQMNFTPEEQRAFALRDGDVLVTEGSGSRAAVGVSAVWRADLPGIVCFQNTLLRLRPRQGVTDGRFLAWWARHARTSGQIAAVATGANILHVGSDGLKRLSLHVPDLGEQRRIAEFLDDRVARIDRIIAARHHQAELMKSEYQSWLDELLAGMPTAPMRRFLLHIEQGWSPVADSVPAGAGESGVLKLGSVRAGSFRPGQNKALLPGDSPRVEYLIKRGDLLITRANTPALVGDVAVVDDVGERSLYLSDLIYRVALHDYDPHLASAALRTTRVRQLIRVVARGTSGSMPKLRSEDLAGLPLPAVSSEEQRQLGRADVRERHLLFSRLAQLSKSIDLMSEFKSSLITAAVMGELDVTTAGSGVPG